MGTGRSHWASASPDPDKGGLVLKFRPGVLVAAGTPRTRIKGPSFAEYLLFSRSILRRARSRPWLSTFQLRPGCSGVVRIQRCPFPNVPPVATKEIVRVSTNKRYID